ncbi:MAG: toxin-antitoxin system HicB family antitoxin [Acidimicrobiia bacterium]
MDTERVIQELRTTIEVQMRLAGDDPTVAAAADAVLTSLKPALRQAALALAEQAATELGAQLPGSTVDVVLSDGEPILRVRDTNDPVTISTDELDARMTVRLPEDLKDDLEIAASELGDSVNTFVVRALTGSANALKRSSRSTFKGTIET